MEKMTIQTKKIKKNLPLMAKLIWAGIIVTTIGLIITIIVAALNIPPNVAVWRNVHNLWYPTGFGANIWSQLSTFTVQSNILVLIFFILALINQITKNKLSTINHGRFKFAVTIYISITFVIFWVALFKKLIQTTDFSKSLDLLIFFNTFLLHLFTPVIMITYFFISSGKNKWEIKSTWTKTLPITISYMFIYLFYALIKGSYIGQIEISSNYIIVDYSYPYFFLNINDNLGIFFLYFFIILLLFLGFFTCYWYYNNWKYEQLDHEDNAKPKKIVNKPIAKK